MFAAHIIDRAARGVSGLDVRAFEHAELASAGTTLTITKPAGTIAGDLMVAIVGGGKGTSAVVTPPTGWDGAWIAYNKEEPGIYVFTKVATGSEGASYDFTSGSSYQMMGHIITCIGGVGFDAAGTVTKDTGGSPYDFTIPGVTAVGGMLFAVFNSKFGNTYSTPTGMTLLSNTTNVEGDSYYIFYEKISAGPTGSITSTSVGSSPYVGVAFSLEG